MGTKNFLGDVWGTSDSPKSSYAHSMCSTEKIDLAKKKGPENDHFWSFSKYGKFKYSFFWSIKHYKNRYFSVIYVITDQNVHNMSSMILLGDV